MARWWSGIVHSTSVPTTESKLASSNGSRSALSLTMRASRPDEATFSRSRAAMCGSGSSSTRSVTSGP